MILILHHKRDQRQSTKSATVVWNKWGAQKKTPGFVPRGFNQRDASEQ
jgi:hypothetical protein